jgi:hypothetical protein
MPEGSYDGVFDALVQRVCSEYLEMPGLKLTARQAQRFWGIDETTCHQVLDFLVGAKFLCLTAHGGYARSTEGRVAKVPLPSANCSTGCADLVPVDSSTIEPLPQMSTRCWAPPSTLCIFRTA